MNLKPLSMPRLCSAFLAFFLLMMGCSSDDGSASQSQTQAQTTDASANGLPTVTVFKSPTCNCCKKWVAHMRENGFTVRTKDRQDVQPVKNKLGVPGKLRSCHTARVGGEVVEGHVPASLVKTYLRSDSARATGLAVPGMPVGSPGMEVPGRDAQPYQVMAFTGDGRAGVYAQRP
jgi:hypothetical protein